MRLQFNILHVTGFLRFTNLQRILLQSGYEIGHNRIQSLDPLEMETVLESARKNNWQRIVCDTSVDTAKRILLKVRNINGFYIYQ